MRSKTRKDSAMRVRVKRQGGAKTKAFVQTQEICRLAAGWSRAASWDASGRKETDLSELSDVISCCVLEHRVWNVNRNPLALHYIRSRRGIFC